MGERFLWVDSVGIIQPDDHDDGDCKSQAPLMWQYYRDSLVTIAASGAPDSSVGFLHERLLERYRVHKCELEPWESADNSSGDSPKTVHVHVGSHPPPLDANYYY